MTCILLEHTLLSVFISVSLSNGTCSVCRDSLLNPTDAHRLPVALFITLYLLVFFSSVYLSAWIRSCSGVCNLDICMSFGVTSSSCGRRHVGLSLVLLILKIFFLKQFF